MPGTDEILSQYPNNAGLGAEINKATINQTTVPGYTSEVDPYTQSLLDAHNAKFQPQEIGAQGQAALYPGMSQDINVGSTSGSVIGSHNIYVPTGDILALDPILARRKAIADAAQLKAQSITPFKYKDPYQLKDQRFQEKFNKQYYDASNSMIEEAKRKYGKDFSIVLQDPNTEEGRKFIQTMANYEVLGKKHDQIIDLIAKIDVADKSKIYTPETYALKKELETMTGHFQDGDVMASKDIDRMYNQLEAYRSFEDYIQKDNFLKEIQGKLTQSGYAYDDKTGDFFNVGTNRRIKYGDAIKEVVQSLASVDFKPEIQAGLYTPEYMEKAIGARLKDSFEQTRSITQKSEATRNAEQEQEITPSSEIVRHSADKPGAGTMYTYKADGTRGDKFDYKPIITSTVSIKGKPVIVPERDAKGDIKQTKFDGITMKNIQVYEDGKTIQIPGNVQAEVVGLSRDKDGRVFAQSRVLIPTKIPPVTSPTGKVIAPARDVFTVQDRLIVLDQPSKDGKIESTGNYKEIRSQLKSDELKKQLDKRYQEVKEWEGKTKNEEPVNESVEKPSGKTEADSFGL